MDPDIKVDAKLVQLAQLLGARLLTNDSNLCKIARLQNVTALNLNELAEALRPQLSSGDELELTLVKEGKEPHQAGRIFARWDNGRRQSGAGPGGQDGHRQRLERSAHGGWAAVLRAN